MIIAVWLIKVANYSAKKIADEIPRLEASGALDGTESALSPTWRFSEWRAQLVLEQTRPGI